MSMAPEKNGWGTRAFTRPNVPGLFAIGDVAGAPWLAHKASHEGVRGVDLVSKRSATSDATFQADRLNDGSSA